MINPLDPNTHAGKIAAQIETVESLTFFLLGVSLGAYPRPLTEEPPPLEEVV